MCFEGGAILEDGEGIDHVQSYDPKTDRWTDLAPMSIARSGSAACVLNHKMYVIGKFINMIYLRRIQFENEVSFFYMDC